jgi:hypothetical protein
MLYLTIGWNSSNLNGNKYNQFDYKNSMDEKSLALGGHPSNYFGGIRHKLKVVYCDQSVLASKLDMYDKSHSLAFLPIGLLNVAEESSVFFLHDN